MGISSHEELFEESMKLVPLFQCLGDETRVNILVLLSDKGEMNVNHITEHIDLSRPAVSHHLLQLKQAGFVEFRKEGNERFYFVRFKDFLNRLNEWLQAFEAECSHLE